MAEKWSWLLGTLSGIYSKLMTTWSDHFSHCVTAGSPPLSSRCSSFPCYSAFLLCDKIPKGNQFLRGKVHWSSEFEGFQLWSGPVVMPSNMMEGYSRMKLFTSWCTGRRRWERGEEGDRVPIYWSREHAQWPTSSQQSPLPKVSITFLLGPTCWPLYRPWGTFQIQTIVSPLLSTAILSPLHPASSACLRQVYMRKSPVQSFKKFYLFIYI